MLLDPGREFTHPNLEVWEGGGDNVARGLKRVLV
jgi:hypothetical protein